MKKTATVIIMSLMTLFVGNSADAQAFGKGTKTLSIGLGGANMWHFTSWNDGPYGGYYNTYSPITGQFSVQGEFAVHKYVGVGFNAGIGGRARSSYAYGGLAYSWGYPSEFNIPIGAIANFHFYQLIADKAKNGSRLHADKLDIYAGLNLGTGVAIHPADDYYFSSTHLSALFWIGPQVGVNYFFTKKLGIKGEVGYGKTFVNAGLIFNL